MVFSSLKRMTEPAEEAGEKQKENKGAEAIAVASAAVEIEELPRAIVRRLVKDKLSQLSHNSDMSILREAQQAFCESARIFIHYLSATANEVCKDSKRQIINAEDVFKALDEMEFTEFIGPLRASLEEFRNKNAEKKSKLPRQSNGEAEGMETVEAEGEDDQHANQSEELRKKNAGKRSSSTKKSKGPKEKRDTPAANREDMQTDTRDEANANGNAD